MHHFSEPKIMEQHLPEHLLSEILIRLPVKSLLKFRTVSKSWNSLIISSNFITSQINHNTTKNSLALVRCYYEDTRKDAYTLHLNNKSLDKISDLDNPSNTREFFYILGCVNGVVCMTDSYQRYNTVLLWNPCVKKYLTLPNPAHELSIQELMQAAKGFGYDSMNNDYKYVRIYKLSNGTQKIDIFRLSTGCWADVDIRGCSVSHVKPTKGVYLDGILHWFSHDNSLIVGFDLNTEKFIENIMVPKELETSNIFYEDLGVWRGLLAVFDKRNQYKVSLWVMKEYGIKESWTKLFQIGGYWSIISISRDGGLILFNNDSVGKTVVDYLDPETKKTKLDVLKLERRLLGIQMEPYIQSLVLLDKGEDLPTPQAQFIGRDQHFRV